MATKTTKQIKAQLINEVAKSYKGRIERLLDDNTQLSKLNWELIQENDILHKKVQELLRWRNSLTETPKNKQVVLVKLAEDCYDVCMYNIYFGVFIGIEGRYEQGNAYDWRPIIEEE